MTNDDSLRLPDLAGALHKYSRVEQERRFLLHRSVTHAYDARCRHIRDRYLIGSRLRLRSVEEPGVPTIFKLGQKIRLDGNSPRSIAHTSMYLSSSEFDILTQLPANELVKARWLKEVEGVTMAIDEFGGLLTGLVLAEIDSGILNKPLVPLPDYLSHEVTDDEFFTGGALATASTKELREVLGTFGINL